ncbi:hypothetical protein IAR55_001641 [Kwoniella newhampshirensis]|uniref:Uncharacterized protein n=1 Tax=Kwoniella newhampshirensis TaxID=1651941 RepID=A0AAW0Z2L6_9TREE
MSRDRSSSMISISTPILTSTPNHRARIASTRPRRPDVISSKRQIRLRHPYPLLILATLDGINTLYHLLLSDGTFTLDRSIVIALSRAGILLGVGSTRRWRSKGYWAILACGVSLGESVWEVCESVMGDVGPGDKSEDRGGGSGRGDKRFLLVSSLFAILEYLLYLLLLRLSPPHRPAPHSLRLPSHTHNHTHTRRQSSLSPSTPFSTRVYHPKPHTPTTRNTNRGEHGVVTPSQSLQAAKNTRGIHSRHVSSGTTRDSTSVSICTTVFGTEDGRRPRENDGDVFSLGPDEPRGGSDVEIRQEYNEDDHIDDEEDSSYPRHRRRDSDDHNLHGQAHHDRRLDGQDEYQSRSNSESSHGQEQDVLAGDYQDDISSSFSSSSETDEDEDDDDDDISSISTSSIIDLPPPLSPSTIPLSLSHPVIQTSHSIASHLSTAVAAAPLFGAVVRRSQSARALGRSSEPDGTPDAEVDVERGGYGTFRG